MTSEIRVLLVDDDAFRDRSATALGDAGFDVVTAADAAAGVNRLGAEIDCVVTEYDLPGCDGLGFVQAVRERQPELPVVLLTGRGDEAVASEAIGTGVTDYLRKGAVDGRFDVLVARIEDAVSERREAADVAESERMLSTLVSNLPGIVYRCRNVKTWPMEYFGGNVEEITGYEANDFLEGDVAWAELIDHPDNEALWTEVQEALDAGEPFEVTYRIVDASGERRWLREQGRRVDRRGPDNGDTSDTIEGFISEITAERQRERAVAEYDRLVDAVGDPVYTTDSEGCFSTINDRMEKRLGYDAEELIGEHVSMVLEPDDVDRGADIVRRLLGDERRSSATYGIAVRTADGDRLELENHTALLTVDGEFYGTVGVLRDTADRPTARLRRLHDATRELMAETDPTRIAELTTRAARDVLDIPTSSVRFPDGESLELVADVAKLGSGADAGGDGSERARPTDGDGTRARPPGDGGCPIDGTIPGRVFSEGERYVVSGEDPEGWIDRHPFDSGACLPLGNHGVFAIGACESDAFEETDIQLATVLAANAEAALDRAEKGAELRRERDDFAALFENIPDPTAEVVMRDAEPIVKRVNPAFEATFGHRTAAIAGENLDEYVVPGSVETDVEAYNRRLQRGLSLHDEVQRMTVDGIRDFIIHIVPHDVGTETARGYAIYTDITDRKRRERELERQNERLDEFASVVSHDLRNPLGVARGHLELARTANEEGLTAHLESIDEAHERMAELIERLLAFARQGDPATTLAEVSLERVTRNAWETVETGALSLVVAGDAEVTADRDRLRQLLENLLRNATEHGETATEITVGPLECGFYFEDDGCGIPEPDREAVLNSGHSGDDGTGFGLSIVETIVDTHGWDLDIVDSEGGGARFEFRADDSSYRP
ncbi:MAG: PAS domain S-box-containing protein [Natronomonas sp.]